MKTMMKKVRPAPSRSYLKHKLVSATAMLLVSAILMVSSSYAWYVLSTAPEVSNIKTQVGANGALEIALLNADSWDTLSLLDMGDIDESATDENPVSAAVANLTWGNLVNLDDASYGMDSIILNPARLNITQDGNDYKVGTVLLKTPDYGEDGRVKGLETTSVAYTYANGTFSNEGGYGVRAIGTASGMSVFQLGMIDARNKVSTYSSDARTAARYALESNGGGLATMVVDYAMKGKTDKYTKADVQNIQNLASDMQSALTEIETALRYVFAGYITTKGAEGITIDTYQAALAAITNTGEGKLTLNQLLGMYPGIKTVIAGTGDMDDITEYINKLTADQAAVTKAYNDCQALLDGTAESFKWADDLIPIILPLVDTEKMTVAGMSVPELKDKVANNNLGELLNEISNNGGMTVTVPSGSGVLSNIADFAGDYWAEVTVAEVTYDKMTLKNVTAKMQTIGVNPTHLNDCNSKIQKAESAESSEDAGITDFYGYAIDLAFRTNANESNLLLQTEPENRVYEGENLAGLQGGGSYMSFTTSGDISATKMIRLMEGIRVVFMDGDQKVLAIAKLDCTLGKDNYKPVTGDDGAETGYYYLDGSANTYQNSDLITANYYNTELAEESHVTFNKVTGKVTAKLYLYDFKRTESMTVDENGTKVPRTDNDGNILYTGGLTLTGRRTGDTAASITALTQDVPQKVTALVYLDGSVVNNSSVAANSMYSMTGTLNLQFSSDADLLPATNTQLKSDTSGIIYTKLESTGYIADSNGALYKVSSGYEIYEGSDGKFYAYDTNFAGEDASQAYSELDYTNNSVLTPVTVTLQDSSGNALTNGLTMAVGETVTVNVVLSDESLKDKVVGNSRAFNVNDLKVTDTEGYYQYSLTGIADGGTYFEAGLTVRVGGNDYKIKTRIDVTVTAAEGGSDAGSGSTDAGSGTETGGSTDAGGGSGEEPTA